MSSIELFLDSVNKGCLYGIGMLAAEDFKELLKDKTYVPNHRALECEKVDGRWTYNLCGAMLIKTYGFNGFTTCNSKSIFKNADGKFPFSTIRSLEKGHLTHAYHLLKSDLSKKIDMFPGYKNIPQYYDHRSGHDFLKKLYEILEYVKEFENRNKILHGDEDDSDILDMLIKSRKKTS